MPVRLLHSLPSTGELLLACDPREALSGGQRASKNVPSWWVRESVGVGVLEELVDLALSIASFLFLFYLRLMHQAFTIIALTLDFPQAKAFGSLVGWGWVGAHGCGCGGIFTGIALLGPDDDARSTDEFSTCQTHQGPAPAPSCWFPSFGESVDVPPPGRLSGLKAWVQPHLE